MTLVVDSNVIAKLLLDEEDRDVAVNFIKAITTGGHRIAAPSLLRLEVFAIGMHHDIPFATVEGLLSRLEASILSIIEPNSKVWERAYSMAQTGHPKSGFPSLQDCLFHALAIELGGTFVTADGRHLAKVIAVGHAAHLNDWDNLVP